MDRFQMIQQASQMKKLRYNNRPIRAGFVDLTLRLGLPNQDYCDNYPTDIGQSLNSSLFNPQQASLNYFNGSHMSTSTHDDQPPMQYWQHGHNNMVSGDHGTDINNYNMIINVAGGPNNFGRFNQTGINMGQITNTESDQAVLSGSQIHYSTPDYSNFNTIMNNPYRSTAISPKPALNDYNINNVLLNPNTTSSTMNTCDGTRRGQLSSRRKNNNRVKKRHSDDDHHHDHDRTVLDVGEEKEEEEEVVVEDHDVVDGGDANYKLRCSNPNCRTQTTPMWRRGPLGPKSLCNACGIKYRKQEERRATEIATAKSGNSSTSTINNLN